MEDKKLPNSLLETRRVANIQAVQRQDSAPIAED